MTGRTTRMGLVLVMTALAIGCTSERRTRCDEDEETFGKRRKEAVRLPSSSPAGEPSEEVRALPAPSVAAAPPKKRPDPWDLEGMMRDVFTDDDRREDPPAPGDLAVEPPGAARPAPSTAPPPSPPTGTGNRCECDPLDAKCEC